MQLGWIDFSETEKNKVLSILNMLSESGTVDELGIAPVRDGFSDRFFPGTSTIQTRAKYFFAVPYALKGLEASDETDPVKILRRLDELERHTAEVLLSQNRNESGIIGKVSLLNGHWVKRTPASIYFAGLKKYGIFTGGNMSLSEYVKISCAIKAGKTDLQRVGNRNDSAEEYECDDKNAGNILKKQFWDIPLNPIAWYTEQEWLNDLSIKLTSSEGAFLKNKIITSCKGTMLSYVLEESMTEFPYLPSFQAIFAVIDKFPEHIRRDYKMALDFSNFIYVAVVLYNVMISGGENTEAAEEFERLRSEMPKRADIDIDGIFANLSIVKPPLKKFLTQIRRCMLEGNVEEMKRHIMNREIDLKGKSRAKSAHPGELSEADRWRGGELDYRFYKATQIIGDIFESEGQGNA